MSVILVGLGFKIILNILQFLVFDSKYTLLF